MIYLDLFLTFFKIGAFTFGGGYAMLPLIEFEVASHGWISLSELVDFIAVSESTPGPFAVNMATFIGSVKGGLFGSFCATLGVVLPSFIVILIIAKFFSKFKDAPAVKGILTGLRPATVGLIGGAVISVIPSALLGGAVRLSEIIPAVLSFDFLFAFLIFALCLVLVFKKVHPILVVLLSAALGIGAGFLLEII